MQVTLHNLTKTFGPVRAVDGISVEFAAGQIHGVLGENGAGKSTLMKLLSGFLRRDSGEVLIGGRPVALRSSAEALAAGIGMVHQEPLDIPAFSVLENIICASPQRAFPNARTTRQHLITLAEQLGFSLDPDTTVASLTVGQRQQMEIMRQLMLGVSVLILDEPTTGISAEQVRRLFAALRLLAEQGKTILFVSHKIDEVHALCNSVTVLRAGRMQGPQLAMPQTTSTLLHLMFGPLPPPGPVRAHTEVGKTFWELQGVRARVGALVLRNINMRFHRGESTGLAGLEGSGQQVLLRLLAGQVRATEGRVLINGQDMTSAKQADFIRAGIEMLPADRAAEGIIAPMTVVEHFALARETQALVSWQSALLQAKSAIADYAIKARPSSPLATLSGGNQQRAMLSLLPAHCNGLLLEQPTRGLDVVSARSIWERLKQRQADGTALVFASADLDELLAYSDHILVFFGGKVSAPIPRADLDASRLAELIGGVGFVEAV